MVEWEMAFNGPTAGHWGNMLSAYVEAIIFPVVLSKYGASTQKMENQLDLFTYLIKTFQSLALREDISV